MCVIGFTACQHFDEAAMETPDQQDVSKISMLAFSSTDDFLSVLDELSDDEEQLPAEIITRTDVVTPEGGQFVDLLEPVGNLPIESDPILIVDCQPLRQNALIVDDDLSLYIAKGYDTLVPNIRVARLLNARAEVKVENTIYKISPRGTYYYPESKQSYFESNYAQFENEDGTQIDSCTYQLAEDIFRYNTFELAEVIDYEDADLPDEIEGDPTVDDDEGSLTNATRAVSLYNLDWSRFPVYKADAKTWAGKIWQSLFGRNKAFTYKLSKKRRVRAKFYYYNYIFYSEIGALGEMQKKNWIGWSNTKADELYVGWHNIILYSDYSRKPNAAAYPTGAKPTMVGSEYMKIPGFNKSGYVVSIMGMELTQSQINSIIGKSSTQLFNWLKGQLSNGDKLSRSEFETVMFYMKDKVITVIPDGGVVKNNDDKHRQVFASDVHILISFSPNNIPSSASSWLNWAKSICTGSMALSRPTLKYGEVRVAGRLGDTWGAIAIRKK